MMAKEIVDSLNFCDRLALCKALDAQKDWKRLAALFKEFFDYKEIIDIEENSNAPTEEVLSVLGRGGIRIITIYHALDYLALHEPKSLLINYVPETERESVACCKASTNNSSKAVHCVHGGKENEFPQVKHGVEQEKKSGSSNAVSERSHLLQHWLRKFTRKFSTRSLASESSACSNTSTVI